MEGRAVIHVTILKVDHAKIISVEFDFNNFA